MTAVGAGRPPFGTFQSPHQIAAAIYTLGAALAEVGWRLAAAAASAAAVLFCRCTGRPTLPAGEGCPVLVGPAGVVGEVVGVTLPAVSSPP